MWVVAHEKFFLLVTGPGDLSGIMSMYIEFVAGAVLLTWWWSSACADFVAGAVKATFGHVWSTVNDGTTTESCYSQQRHNSLGFWSRPSRMPKM